MAMVSDILYATTNHIRYPIYNDGNIPVHTCHNRNIRMMEIYGTAKNILS